MKKLLEKFTELKEAERLLKEQRTLLEGEIYELIQDQLNDDKTLTVIADEYKLSVKPNFVVKVDQEKASHTVGIFKTKYEMSYSQYKKSEIDVDDYVTITQNKPGFTVEIK